jgi:hypothetical protein
VSATAPSRAKRTSAESEDDWRRFATDYLERLGYGDCRRGEAIVRDLERELGLRQVAPSRQASRAAPGRGELAAFACTGQV